MDEPGTITRIIRELEGADPLHRDSAVRELWERFFADMTAFARKRLRAMNAPLGPADEEDAAARALTKVCGGIERGQLRLANRVDLANVLRSATAHEVLTLRSRARCTGGRFQEALSRVPDPSLSPDLLLLAFDACQRLLLLLDSDNHRQVAVWKLAGHTNEAVAVRLGCSPATVERILSRIREIWRRKWADAVPRGAAKSGPRRGMSEAAGQAGPVAEDPGRISQEDQTQLLRELAGLP